MSEDIPQFTDEPLLGRFAFRGNERSQSRNTVLFHSFNRVSYSRTVFHVERRIIQCFQLMTIAIRIAIAINTSGHKNPITLKHTHKKRGKGNGYGIRFFNRNTYC